MGLDENTVQYSKADKKVVGTVGEPIRIKEVNRLRCCNEPKRDTIVGTADFGKGQNRKNSRITPLKKKNRATII